MKLLSINTSPSLAVEYQDKTINTGIFKKPSTGPVYVAKDHLHGDQQADLKNHGGEHKAVYAFSFDHYAYWSRILEKSPLNKGIFGENLTISGFDEENLHIGDQLSIGECLLEITQPRVPCYKLGLAVGNNKMPRLFIEHFATGIYMRVLKEGFIEAGDEVIIRHQNPFKVSVKSLFRAVFDKNFEPAEQVIRTAKQIPELSLEWQKKIALA